MFGGVDKSSYQDGGGKCVAPEARVLRFHRKFEDGTALQVRGMSAKTLRNALVPAWERIVSQSGGSVASRAEEDDGDQIIGGQIGKCGLSLFYDGIVKLSTRSEPVQAGMDLINQASVLDPGSYVFRACSKLDTCYTQLWSELLVGNQCSVNPYRPSQIARAVLDVAGNREVLQESVLESLTHYRKPSTSGKKHMVVLLGLGVVKELLSAELVNSVDAIMMADDNSSTLQGIVPVIMKLTNSTTLKKPLFLETLHGAINTMSGLKEQYDIHIISAFTLGGRFPLKTQRLILSQCEQVCDSFTLVDLCQDPVVKSTDMFEPTRFCRVVDAMETVLRTTSKGHQSMSEIVAWILHKLGVIQGNLIEYTPEKWAGLCKEVGFGEPTVKTLSRKGSPYTLFVLQTQVVQKDDECEQV
uniref:Uncharacterized protein n=1 Tax=Mucochytrium quahogii TaxID=96639 RepID=A0A7S2RVZ1_9STRA|mmetsp:Transcript_20854/g.45530  ORF Transcript_20854/g.45530 Transcript_20854/m.45530 type:complete len:413 (+) Transcript_20854:3-1241(+)